ncbi:hypothetical protein [Nocardioides jiangxiensis]|uniref:Integral membrane protein n=1 Tax=Nocardioides jiangxiensis TaxID=3064524 RepID=A0ABT9B1L4_9ACTN|nr:hypothetical protein [Nocardioides sp. WY-20]MDO7867166.1 hypothetical protein [Nocardioides sp. WY-20]
MASRYSRAETTLLLGSEGLVIAAGFAGLIGENQALAGLVTGLVAVAVAAGLLWGGSRVAWPALGAGIGFTVAQAYVLASGWGDEELIDPLVVLGAIGILAGVPLAGATESVIRGGRSQRHR